MTDLAGMVPPPAPRTLPELARDIIRLGVGGRLPTALQYQERLDVGSGTVQKALRQLQQAGAVRLRARGHRGTFVSELDLGVLWRMAELDPLHVLFPPAGPVEGTGLAAGLCEAVAALGLRLTLGYQPGAVTRLEALQSRSADLALISSGAARDLQVITGHADEAGAASGEFTAIELGSGTYYGKDSLVVVFREHARRGTGLRVGIDPASDDHSRLTRAEFGHETGTEFVTSDFTRVPAGILEGCFDAGVWHKMDLLIPPHLAGLKTRPLHEPGARRLAEELSGAVLVAVRGSESAAVLERIDPGLVRRVQDDVVKRGPQAIATSLRVRPY